MQITLTVNEEFQEFMRHSWKLEKLEIDLILILIRNQREKCLEWIRESEKYFY